MEPVSSTQQSGLGVLKLGKMSFSGQSPLSLQHLSGVHNAQAQTEQVKQEVWFRDLICGDGATWLMIQILNLQFKQVIYFLNGHAPIFVMKEEISYRDQK